MKIRGLVNLMKHGVLGLVVLLIPLTFPSLSNATEDYDWHHNGYPAIDPSQSNQYATYMYTTAEIGIGGTNEPGVPLKVHGDLRTHGICDENGDNCKDISTGWSTATGDGHSLDAADGSAANVVYVNNSGNVGIGTTSPDGKLHIKATTNPALLVDGMATPEIRINGTSQASISMIDTDATANSREGRVIVDGDKMKFETVNDSRTVATPHMTVDLIDGNVGIGTLSPQSELAVNGTITAKEIKVTDTGWADFVFDENYILSSLEEVASFISEHKHLPDIPSAKEVQEQGLAISEMLAKQMQKIEEMTLYLIQLKKENDQLKKRVALLEEVGTPVKQNKMND